MRKMWYLEDVEHKDSNNNISDRDLHPVLKKILFRRGLYTDKEIKGFLYGSLEDLHDPYLLKDMEQAVEKIIHAEDKHSKIIVYGDYDVDGITGTALLYNYFQKRFGIKIDYYVPDRLQEGYGLNLNAIKNINKCDYDLLITVDCGITAIDEIEYAQSRGLDVIVTDHHQPAAQLPPALAIINPHRKGETYPFFELAGVGVAFKLCMALEKKLTGKSISDLLLNELDLVALGSVADIVPIRGENRILIKEGIKIITSSKKPGLRALLHKLNLENCEINTGRIGYILAPPLNAAGRMEDAKMGIRLFTTEDKQEADELADTLVALNRERQREERKTLKAAEEMINKEINLKKERGIILASSDWHQGVIGIVASRIVEKYYKPTILISLDGNLGKGSCRSIDDLNLYEALVACENHLESFGGHAQAAGLTIKHDQIEKFRDKFNSYLDKTLTKQDLVPRLWLDEIIEVKDINLELYQDLELLKPFGVGNPRPRFLINNVQVEKCYCVGKNNQHLKLTLASGIEAIGFEFGDLKNNLQGQEVDLAFDITVNKWNGQEKIQIKINDINIRADDNFYPIYFKSSDLIIADKRGNGNHYNYLKYLMKYNVKVAAYINNIKIYNNILHKLKDTDIPVNGQEQVAKFNRIEKGILIFSNPDFTKKAKIDELVFISLPFSLQDIIKMATVFDLSPYRLHFLFGEEDYYINKKLIKNKLPTAGYLRRLYLKLKSICNPEITCEKIYGQLAKDEFTVNEKLLNTSLTIFNELGLIDNNQSHIKLVQEQEDKLDLSYSIRYNEITNVVEQFNELSRFVFADNMFMLIDKLKQGLKE